MAGTPAYEKTTSWTLSPYDDSSNAFVFVREPPGVIILGKSSWLALELCTRHAPDVAVARFTEIAGRGIPPQRAHQVFDRTVASLRSQGLIRPSSAEAACS